MTSVEDSGSQEGVALLLAKIERYPDMMFWDSHERHVDDVVLPLMVAGLVDVPTSWRDSANVLLTEAGKALLPRATPEALCGPQPTGRDRAAAALWLWLLLNGTQANRYGDSYPYGRGGEVVHLLSCGLDLSASTPVKDDTWVEDAGSFADGDRVTGVSGSATCRCGAVKRFDMVHEITSVTALVWAILDL
jgi:hypothetical protein